MVGGFNVGAKGNFQPVTFVFFIQQKKSVESENVYSDYWEWGTGEGVFKIRKEMQNHFEWKSQTQLYYKIVNSEKILLLHSGNCIVSTWHHASDKTVMHTDMPRYVMP
jgi:hypothetical protein